MPNIFFSYTFEHHLTVEYYYSMLSRYAGSCDIFFYEKIYHEKGWKKAVNLAINAADTFVYFLGKKPGSTQREELEDWNKLHFNIREFQKKSICVEIDDLAGLKIVRPEGFEIVPFEKIDSGLDKYSSFKYLFFKITGRKFTFPDGLPSSAQIFNYEKDIIDFYLDKYIIKEKLKNAKPETEFTPEEEKIFKDITEKLQQGITPDWPQVKIIECAEEIRYRQIDNPILKEIGSPRKSQVFAAALTNYHNINPHFDDIKDVQKSKDFSMKAHSLSFPEAGPREKIYSPIISHQNPKYKVAILVSGGIAPGINSVIDGITQRHFKYADKCGYLDRMQVLGLRDGFNFFNNIDDFVLLYPNQQLREMRGNEQNSIVTSELINVGGSMIGTSRYPELEVEEDSRMKELKRIIHELEGLKINILYIIGGEGSMKAAHALSVIYEEINNKKNNQWNLNIVGIPKTMDNDILWVWQTFGFMSAVEKAREFIDYLAVEIVSNPRIGIVQLFGSNSGFVVSHAVLASRTGVCDFALIPESNYTLKKLIDELKQLLITKNYALMIMSETAIPLDSREYLERYNNLINLTEEELNALEKYFNDNRKINGHIHDKLRDASFKIVKIAIEQEINDNIQDERRFRILSNEPRHLIRAIPPSTIDIINASRLGTLAVDNAIAGYTDCMVSQWLTEYCLIPLELVVLGRKRIPKNGIFWKSVISKTGQDEILYDSSEYDDDGNKLKTS